jgi:hypothetical protein
MDTLTVSSTIGNLGRLRERMMNAPKAAPLRSRWKSGRKKETATFRLRNPCWLD